MRGDSILKLFEKVFGTHSDRKIKKIRKMVDKVLNLDKIYQELSDQELRNKTLEFKERLASGETLDDILPEAFATVREASSRVLGLKPYEVQIIGGIILHQGRIAEMKTGEGKTLVATMPTYLNVLGGKGAFIIYAIIDEIDSILIDEARTPLIISGAGYDLSENHNAADKFVRKLKITCNNS